MLTAKEMWKITEVNRGQKSSHWEDVCAGIRENANRGKSAVFFCEGWDESVFERLADLGYKIYQGGANESASFDKVVSWYCDDAKADERFINEGYIRVYRS